MRPDNRDEFEIQLAQLCAGFNVPATTERREALWRGLAVMTLGEFARVVEHCLGAEGPDRYPTAGQIWAIHRELRKRAREPSTGYSAAGAAEPAPDDFTVYGNRRLFTWLQQFGAVPDAIVGDLVAAKNRLVAEFREIDSEDRVTGEEFGARLRSEWDRIRRNARAA